MPAPTTVSVLIAAYQAAAFLPAALASLRAQTHRAWELVVVEDGSHDDTEQLVHEFSATVSQPVRYENLGTNRGVAAARNRLLARSAGDVVAFLDADDLWDSGHLAGLVATLARGHALAFSGIVQWDGATHRALGAYRPASALVARPRRGLFLRSFIHTSSCVALPRLTIARTGAFDETLRIGEDRDYWFRAVAAGGTLACTGLDTCRYTKHSGSSMTRTLRVAEDTVRFYEKHAEAADVRAGLRRQMLSDARWNLARLLRRDEPAAAARLGWSAWRTRPWQPLLLGWCLAASLANHRSA